MGAIYPGIPPYLLNFLKSKSGHSTFIETGTYLGDTTAVAAQNFERVVTIEASKELHASAAQRFASETGVRVVLGESGTKLRDVLQELHEPAIFWLDAHWSGSGTAGEHYECPLLTELGAISAHRDDHVVLVDDARYFLSPPPPPHDPNEWPGVSEVTSALGGARADRYVVVIDDVFVSVPRALKPDLTDLLGQRLATLNRDAAASSVVNNFILSMLNHMQDDPPIAAIHSFNQSTRDRWVAEKAKSFPAGTSVLDVGAGTCPYQSFFAHARYHSHDFKAYEGYIDFGRQEGLYGRIDYISDILEIPVGNASFEAILCTEVLEHVPDPIGAVGEMARILKPGGRMLLTAPLASALHQEPYHFYGGYTPHWYRWVASRFELEVVEITPNGGFYLHLAQECARVAWLVGGGSQAHGENREAVGLLFGELLPRYLSTIEGRSFLPDFTVGYHVELRKKER